MSGSRPGRATSTYVYKRVGDLAIEVEVERDTAPGERPAVVWIHGGALIMGHRRSVPAWLSDACEASGFVLASIDYRLAPETRLPEIVQDVVDAVGWIRERGPEQFHANPAAIALVGESAGGYLALTAGFLVQPPPAAVVSLWGYGDLVGSWYAEPSPHPRHHRVRLSSEEAERQVSGPPIADGRQRAGDGDAFYQYCRQHGLWPTAVSGWDPVREADRFRPLMPIANVTDDYPPTMLVHGELDTDVPHDRSLLMASELAEHRVEHEMLSIPDAEHGLVGADPATIGTAFEEAGAFLRRHLGVPGGP